VVWQKDLPRDYQTKTALWGYASHPLIDGQKLICLVGGEGSHVVAFDKDTGTEIWRALTSSEQGYSPPTIFEAAGVRQLILLRPDAVTSVDPETGQEYWSVPYEASNGSIIMSPIKAGDLLYAGGFSNKNILIKLATDRPGAEVLWRDLPRRAVSPVNVQPMLDQNVIYGFDQKGTFVAVELPSGERLWETAAPLAERPLTSGTAFIVKHFDRYWLFTEQGELIIATLSPDGFKEIDRAKVIEPTNVAMGRDVVWSMPAFANQCAYVRNDHQCICVDLSAK
jgi:outer membrane protein assembly factor BamB